MTVRRAAFTGLAVLAGLATAACAMNGDAGAYQGQLTAALTGGEVRVYPSPTKNGNIRVNYIAIIGA